jgi:hypothetical protein
MKSSMIITLPHTCLLLPIPVAARSKAWVYGRSLTGIVGSNCRSQWPCGLRRGSTAARLLGLWVRIADPSGRAV